MWRGEKAKVDGHRLRKGIIRLNEPEKGSNPRLWKASQKLIAMLNALPRTSERVFGNGPINSLKTSFSRARKRLAAKLQNPRLLSISFHTFRHWKATMLYHQTKDPMYVKQFLGHKELRNTEIYITLERTLFESGSDEFIVKVAQTPEEVKALLEVGFDCMPKRWINISEEAKMILKSNRSYLKSDRSRRKSGRGEVAWKPTGLWSPAPGFKSRPRPHEHLHSLKAS